MTSGPLRGRRSHTGGGQCGVRIVNTLRPRQTGCRFADDVFKCIFFNENVLISLKISPKFVPKVPINNIPALVQILAWCRSGKKPLSEPMIVSLLTHIYASLGLNELTHWGLLTQKYVNCPFYLFPRETIGHSCLRGWLVIFSAISHYLNRFLTYKWWCSTDTLSKFS